MNIEYCMCLPERSKRALYIIHYIWRKWCVVTEYKLTCRRRWVVTEYKLTWTCRRGRVDTEFLAVIPQ